MYFVVALILCQYINNNKEQKHRINECMIVRTNKKKWYSIC